MRGYVSAYDADTGELRWRFYTVPGDPSKGADGAASDPVMARAAETWTGEWWAGGGGGTVWDAIVYDPEFDQLLVGVGNGSPWNQQIRSPGGGDNLFLASIVALDAKTGAYRWHYQTTPGETWDYTATQPIILADLTIDGRPRKVAMQAPKNGFFYVIDRSDGRLISASPSSRCCPRRHAEGSARRVGLRGRSRRAGPSRSRRRATRAAALIAPALRRPQLAPDVVQPADRARLPPDAGHGVRLRARRRRSRGARGFDNLGGAHRRGSRRPAGAGGHQEQRRSGAPGLGPRGAEGGVAAARRGPWNGGTLAVAGGLVFQGTVDGRFLALDAKTGGRRCGPPTIRPPRSPAHHLRSGRRTVRRRAGRLRP